MNATEIIKAIGDGVAAALNTNQLFLGVEVDAYQNADIHPEYVTTVEVAKKLTAPDRQVSLETHMKELRKQARLLARIAQGRQKSNLVTIDATLAQYRFGRKDSQRLDILVRSSDALKLPLLVAEAKLGARNLSGIISDIDRIVRLMSMFHDLQLLQSAHVYGAVVFHSMEEGNNSGASTGSALGLLSGVQAYLATIKLAKPWLYAKAGLLTHGAKIQPVMGYTEHYDDGMTEEVFAKESFSFAPGIVLLGNNNDVATAQL